MLKLSRAELHELIWSKPMTEIARHYGVRDMHVAQACDAFDVARPRPGYWQKVGHGKPVETAELHNTRYAATEIVTVAPPAKKAEPKQPNTARKRAA